MDGKRFRELVGEVLASLPLKFAKKLDNVSVVVEDSPTPSQLKKLGLSPGELLFGLYEGIPQAKRGNYSGVLPDKITIFKNSIEEVSQTEESVRAQIRATVIHEIGHHFGLSDSELK